MPQLFRPGSNHFAYFSLSALLVFISLIAVSAYAYLQSSQYNGVGVFHEQPIPFSHKHHVKGLGLDCRFCHSAVEKSSTAGMPSTEVCMSCHSQVFKGNLLFSPLRKSLSQNTPIKWNRVHVLPDHVFFNHSIHVNKGISCLNCHGEVENMPLVKKTVPLTMKWCLECHNNPEKFISKDKLHVDRTRLNNCYECHR